MKGAMEKIIKFFKRFDLTIGGETRTYVKGDTYVVPEGVEHSARIPYGCIAMDYFADPDRY